MPTKQSATLPAQAAAYSSRGGERIGSAVHAHGRMGGDARADAQ